MRHLMKSAHILSVIALSATLAAPLSATAGEGSSCHFQGNQPASETAVNPCATQRRDSLLKTDQLDPSWQTVQPAKPEQGDGQKGKEWTVVFQNPAATDTSKKTRRMLFSLPGNFIAANHTGK